MCRSELCRGRPWLRSHVSKWACLADKDKYEQMQMGKCGGTWRLKENERGHRGLRMSVNDEVLDIASDIGK